MTTTALSQSQFRGRSDTSSPDTAATFIAALNTNFSRDAGSPFRIRFTVQETGGGNPAAHTVKLRYNLNGAGYNDITSSSSVVQSSTAASTSADETAITSRQLSGTGTFANGVYSEDGSTSTSVDMVASGSTEYEFGLVIVANDVKGNDTIQFQIVALSGTTLTYTQTPTVTVNAGVAKTSSITVTQAEAVTLRRVNAHIVAVAFAEAVTLIRRTSKWFSISIGETVTASARAIRWKLISVASSQDVSGLAIAHIRSSQTGAGIGQLVSPTANFVAGGGGPANTNKTLNVSIAQTVSLLRAMRHGIAVAQAQTLSLFRSAAHGITVSQGQDISGTASAHILSSVTGTGIGQLVTKTATFVAAGGANTNKTLNVAQAQAVSMLRAIAKRIAIVQAQAVAVLRLIGHRISIGQGQDISGSANAHIRSSVTGTGLLQSVHAFAARSVASTAKILNISQAQDISGVALARLRSSVTGSGIGQIVTKTATYLPTGPISKLITVTQDYYFYITIEAHLFGTFGKPLIGQSVRLIKQTGHRINVSIGQFVQSFQQFSHNLVQFIKVLNVSIAQTITLRRAIAHRIVSSIGETVRLFRNSTRTIAVGIGQTITLRFGYVRTLLVSISQLVHGDANKDAGSTTNLPLPVSQSQTVSLRRSAAHIISIAIGELITLRRNGGHLIAVSIAQSIRLLRAVRVSILVAQAQSVTQAAYASIRHVITIGIGSVVTVFPVPFRIISNYSLQFNVAVNQSVRLLRSVGTIISIAIGQTVISTQLFMGKVVPLTLNSSIGQQITRFVSVGKILAIGIGQVIRLIRQAPVWSASMRISTYGGGMVIKTAGGSVDINFYSGTVTVHEV